MVELRFLIDQAITARLGSTNDCTTAIFPLFLTLAPEVQRPANTLAISSLQIKQWEGSLKPKQLRHSVSASRCRPPRSNTANDSMSPLRIWLGMSFGDFSCKRCPTTGHGRSTTGSQVYGTASSTARSAANHAEPMRSGCPSVCVRSADGYDGGIPRSISNDDRLPFLVRQSSHSREHSGTTSLVIGPWWGCDRACPRLRIFHDGGQDCIADSGTSTRISDCFVDLPREILQLHDLFKVGEELPDTVLWPTLTCKLLFSLFGEPPPFSSTSAHSKVGQHRISTI